MYLVFVVVWMPFPTVLPVDGSTINYAGPLVGAIILGALIDWVFSGSREVSNPYS